MPFLKAGFNARHRRLGIFGWTRALQGRLFEPAELIRFDAGDLAWLGIGERFLAWGETVVLGSYGINLPDEWQFNLPQSALEDKPAPCDGKVALIILGEPASKANSRELVVRGARFVMVNGQRQRVGGRPMFIKSDKALEYERDALLQIPPRVRVRFEGPVRVSMHIFYATERPDLDESLILDVLQDRYVKNDAGERVLVQKGVYRNDRQVREKHVYWGKDPANPRAEIEVEPLEAPIFREARAA